MIWPYDWRVHPGELLREILEERGIPQAELSRRLGVNKALVNHIVTGNRGIGVKTALRLEAELGAPDAEFWLRCQMIYDLHAAREAANEKGAA